MTEMEELNPAFKEEKDPEFEDVLNREVQQFKVIKRRRKFTTLNRIKLYIFYFAVVLLVFGVVLFFVMGKYESLTNTLSTFDLKNHNYSLLVNSYSLIASQMFASMNQTVDPCTDFYEYSCGGWISSVQLDSETPRVSRSFGAIQSQNIDVLLKIVKNDWPIITPYFMSCNQSYQSGNFTTITNLYTRINNVTSTDLLFRELALIRTDTGIDLSGFAFSFQAIPDIYTPSVRVLALDQADLTLPSKDYYSNSLGLINVQEYYRYITALFALSPHPIGIDEAMAIYSYEAAVANLRVSGERANDASQMYRKVKWIELMNNLPKEIVIYLNSLGVLPGSQRTSVIVQNSDFFTPYTSLLRGLSLNTVKNIALFSLFRHTYPLLGPQYFDAQRGLSSLLLGVTHKLQTPAVRERMCVAVVQSDLEMLMGHYFVNAVGIDDIFKQQITSLTESIQLAFAKRLDSNAWMDTTTRNAATGKLSAMHKQICYPNDWKYVVEFEQRLGTPLNPNNYFENALRINAVYDKQSFERLGSPIDPNSWTLYRPFKENPSVVNAYYSPDFNRITIPAGITRPPFLYAHTWKHAPISSIYGALGAVIGHEITHGFDNMGRRFAADGAFANWWTSASDNAFSIASQCMVNFYNSLETQIPNVYVNGANTLGENIADLGGLEASYDAFVAQTAKLNEVERVDYTGALDYVFPEFSDTQLFFIFYAQTWCEKATDDAVLEQVESDPHTPHANRVQGVLMNMPRFAEAFNCPANSAYSPPDRCVVW